MVILALSIIDKSIKADAISVWYMLVVISIDSLTNVVQGAFFFFIVAQNVVSSFFILHARLLFPFLEWFAAKLRGHVAPGYNFLAPFYKPPLVYLLSNLCRSDRLHKNEFLNEHLNTTFIKNIISFGISFSRFVTYRFTVKASKWLDLRVILLFFFQFKYAYAFFSASLQQLEMFIKLMMNCNHCNLFVGWLFNRTKNSQ